MAIAPNVHRDRNHNNHINIRIIYINTTALVLPTPQYSPVQPGPNIAKVLQVTSALKWACLGRIYSELSDLICVGFMVGSTIERKLSLLNFRPL